MREAQSPCKEVHEILKYSQTRTAIMYEEGCKGLPSPHIAVGIITAKLQQQCLHPDMCAFVEEDTCEIE